MLEVAIVGGGPAGLEAALILGRCGREVLLLDAGTPRNARARALHGFLSRDGVPPAELLRVAREQLAPYGSVRCESIRVVGAACLERGFALSLADGREIRARKVLLATGVEDELPEIEGFDELYGTSIHHCPYCDGWEHKDRALAAYGPRAHGLALELLGWSRDVVVCSDGPAELSTEEHARLERNGILVREERVRRLASEDGRLRALVFEDGTELARDALFFATGQSQQSALAIALGCERTGRGAFDTGEHEATGVPGLYVAGDASPGEQLVVVAAAEGAKAAIAIQRELLAEERR
jgi:thioredoxin reductase